MFRFFSALCIISIMALLGLQRGEANSLPERPPWLSSLDGGPDRNGLGASARPLAPAATWAPPTEIAEAAAKLEGDIRGALVWLPPAEIAPAAAFAALVPASPIWALPAEIALKAPTIEHRSVARGALVWLPPMEIASAPVAEPVGRAAPAASESLTNWSPPAEIAAKVSSIARPTAPRAMAWRPPAEIAREIVAAADRADRS